jgi:hypothetical protein
MEDEKAVSKGIVGTPVYGTITENKAAYTSWQTLREKLTLVTGIDGP